MVTLAVDAGTTETKSVVFDRDGRQVAIAAAATQVTAARPGFAEQDPLQVWRTVVDTARQAWHFAGAAPSDLAAITLTGQGDGCWLVDHKGRPTGAAVLWNDNRAAALVEAWQQDGRLEQAFRINGSVGFPGSPHAILSWLLRHDPDRVTAAAAALTCTGWLFSCLTGQLGIDESDAAAPWLDIAAREYSADILNLFDLTWASRLLPPLRREDQRVAPLAPPAADLLGFPVGTPVVMAPYDLVATSAGAGATNDQQACTILGTTISTQVVTSRADTAGTPVGLTIPMGRRYLRALPTLAGTQVLAWTATLLQAGGPAELSALAGHSRAGADGLIFLPYLSPAGERAPFLEPAARGSFAGMSFDHDRAEVARAVFEGLTFVIRDCLRTLAVTSSELRLCGGGANSPLWRQLIADIVGVPVAQPADQQVGARGAYCYSLVATGAAPDLATATATHVRTRRPCLPDASRHRIYTCLFEDFLAVRADAARSWHRLARTRARITP